MEVLIGPLMKTLWLSCSKLIVLASQPATHVGMISGKIATGRLGRYTIDGYSYSPGYDHENSPSFPAIGELGVALDHART